MTPALVIGGHLLQPTVFDVLAWTVVTFLVARWVRVRDDRLLLGAGLVTAVALQIMHATPEAAVSYDARETVGWPALAAAVARAYRPGDVIVAEDYGAAGAVDRYGPALGLPRAYSGHNGLWYTGRPPDRPARVLFLRAPREYLLRFWTDVRLAGTVDDGVGLDNEEQGRPIWACSGQRLPWSALWPRLRHLG